VKGRGCGWRGPWTLDYVDTRGLSGRVDSDEVDGVDGMDGGLAGVVGATSHLGWLARRGGWLCGGFVGLDVLRFWASGCHPSAGGDAKKVPGTLQVVSGSHKMRLHYLAKAGENKICMSLRGKGLCFWRGGNFARNAQVRANREGLI